MAGVKCQLISSCPSFETERRKWKELAKGSKQYSAALEKLKAQICNKQPQMVCCTGDISTTTTTTTTTTPTTTTTATAILNESSKKCQSGSVCQPMSQCPSFIQEKNRWKQLEKGSAE